MNIYVWPTHEGCVNYINSTPLNQIMLLEWVKIFNKCIIYQIHKTLSMLIKEHTYVEYKRKGENERLSSHNYNHKEAYCCTDVKRT